MRGKKQNKTKKTMFLPGPKSGGFVLDSAMTTCPRLLRACDSAQADCCMHSLRYRSNQTYHYVIQNIMQKLYMYFSFSLLNFMRILKFVQLHYSNNFSFLYTPSMFILTVAVVCASDYRPEHFSRAQIPARCACPGYQIITLKAPITTAAHNIYKYFFIAFQKKEDDVF